MTYSKETEFLMDEIKKRGLNLWAMIGIFRRRSKLSPVLPDEVVNSICREYLKRSGTIQSDFPYFLKVLKRKSEEYFSNKNRMEHEKIKKEPLALKNIFKELANQ